MDACNKICRHSDVITLHTSRFIMKGTGKWVSFSKELKNVRCNETSTLEGTKMPFPPLKSPGELWSNSIFS